MVELSSISIFEANEVKVIISQALIECVENGLFTEEEMSLVENSLNIFLGSIEDLHKENIKEKDYDNGEMSR